MKSWPVYTIVFVGLLLLLVEYFFNETSDHRGLLFGITLIPMFCYAALTWLELRTIEAKRQAKSGTLVGAYMLFKGLRLLATLVAIAIYIYISAPLRMMFVANMLIFFLATLVATSISHLRAERRD